MLENIILKTDSYKVSHYKQYPPGTKKVFSYLEARKGKEMDDIVFFGLQYILKRHFQGIQVTQEKIDEADRYLLKHLSRNLFNKQGWQRLLEKHKGVLPVKIKAVKEGSINSRGDVLVTIENTDPEFFWLTNYLETILMQSWYPITVASKSFKIKKLISKYLDQTGDISGLPFKLHDFGYRGVSSSESAAIGGAAHLVNFSGTDTIASLELLSEFYGSDVCGFSIPASEHSTITAWGKDKELDAMENMLDQYPTGLVACVSDSFDIFNACENIWGTRLKEKILERDGVLVIRPDSGDPVEVVRRCMEILGGKMGFYQNKKGYSVLNDKIRVIQGDGVDFDSIKGILDTLKISKISADNIAFGMGGALLQKLNRDTYSFALKCSATDKGYGWEDAYKDPVTDPGKVSKKGYLDNGNLELVFEDGKLKRDVKIDDIRLPSLLW